VTARNLRGSTNNKQNEEEEEEAENGSSEMPARMF
jgi:hypothetical protein